MYYFSIATINTRFSTTRNKKKLIGQAVNYGFNDSVVSVIFFNKQGKKHGRALAWFEDSRSKSVEGLFKENKNPLNDVSGFFCVFIFNSLQLELLASVIKFPYFDVKGDLVLLM